MVLDEERCIRCALCVKRCPYDAITMERFELQEVAADGRLYKESYRDTQLGPRRHRQSSRGRGIRQVTAELRGASSAPRLRPPQRGRRR